MIIQSIFLTSARSSSTVISPTACWFLRKRSASSPSGASSAKPTLPTSTSESGGKDGSPDLESRVACFSWTLIVARLVAGHVARNNSAFATIRIFYTFSYTVIHPSAPRSIADIVCKIAYHTLGSTHPYHDPCLDEPTPDPSPQRTCKRRQRPSEPPLDQSLVVEVTLLMGAYNGVKGGDR